MKEQQQKQLTISVDEFFYDEPNTPENGNVNSSNNKHLWIKKATGLGISEFMLRFIFK